MSDLRAAAQQALEALEMSRRFVYADNRPQCDEAIAALRAALAQQDEPKGGDNLPPPLQAKPVQEPAAWRLWDEDPQGGGDWRYYDAKDFKEGIDPMKYFDGLVPLYTAPPQRQPMQEQVIEDTIEAAYWHFDARKKGLNEWASAPQSERDAFKAEARKLVRGYFPTRQAQDTKREMLAVADAFIRGKRAALAQQDEPAWMHPWPPVRAQQEEPQTLDEAMQQPRVMAQAYENGYKAGAAAEREACAKVCEHQPHWVACAAAIRARRNT